MTDLSDQLEKTSRDNGYSRASPEPLISPSFPDTFAPSAFHELVRRASGIDGHPPIQPSAGVQWVYRHIDLRSAPYAATHLLAFRMFVGLQGHAVEGRPAALRHTLALMGASLEAADIPLRDLTVTVFGGGEVAGLHLTADRLMVDAWREFGLTDRQIVPVPGVSLYALGRRVGELVGPRCEVFAHHSALGTIEIGTVVTEDHWVNHANHQLGVLPRQVTGIALGVERLDLFARRMSDVLELILQPNGETLGERSDHRLRTTHASAFAGLVKGLHAAVRIEAEISPDTPRPYLARYRQLLRATLDHRTALGLDAYPLEDLARAAFGSGLFAEGNFFNGGRGALHGAR